MIAIADSPFVHAFAHDGRWYVYDVNTNKLLEVDSALGKTLVALTSERPTRSLHRLAAETGREAIEGALTEIEEARRDDGLLLSQQPKIVPGRLSDDDWASYDSKLSHLILSTTEDCNLSCRYCPQAAARSIPDAPSPRAMSSEVALRALAYFADHSRGLAIPTVTFYGGEPLMRPDLIHAVIRAARSRSNWPQFRFLVSTNGTLLDEDAVDLIAKERLHLQISLDGPPEVHDRWRVFRGGRGTHATVIAGLERLLRRDPGAAERISFQVTVAPHFDLGALVEWFDEFAPYHDLDIVSTPKLRVSYANLTWRDELPPNGETARSQIARARGRWLDACAGDHREDLDLVTCGLFDPQAIRFYHRSRERMPEAISPGGGCVPGVRRLNVTADGCYEPCERAATRLGIGNVVRGIEAEGVVALMESYAQARGQRCRSCWAVRLCSICYAALERDAGTGELLLREERCRDARNGAATTLSLYASLLSRGEAAATFLRDSRVS